MSKRVARAHEPIEVADDDEAEGARAFAFEEAAPRRRGKGG